MAARDRDRRIRRIIRWLTALVIITGIFSTLMYASGGDMAIRYVAPQLGAWWDAYQFAIMEASATMLGLLIAIRCASRLVEDDDTGRRAKILSLLAALIIFIPLAPQVASIARFGWDGHSAVIRDFLQAVAGYGTGNVLDKIAIGGIYFLKSIAFAALAGLALYAIVMVIVVSFEKSETADEQREAPTS